MKVRFALIALGAVLANESFAASPFSIYFNAEGSSNCYVNNVSNVSVLPDGNMLASASPTPAFTNCGTGNGTAPAVTMSIAPTTVNAGTTPVGTSTLTWSANNVASCTTSGTDSSVGTEFATQWTATTVSCAGSACTGTPHNVTLTPLAAGNDGVYKFGLQCASADGTAGAFTAASVSVTGSKVSNNVSFSAQLAPASYAFPDHNGGNKSLTFTAVNATLCTGAITGATGASFTGGTTLCSGSTTCNSQVTAAATFPANASTTTNASYNVAVTCSGSGNPATSNATVTVPPVSTITACTTGTTGDVPGYTALCSGPMSLHNSGGANVAKGPFAYSFANVFGGPWPGTYFGYTEIFNLGKTQFLAIPFVGNPAHAIAWVENQTYTPQPVTFSVSTAPGLFNGGVKNGTTVICVASRNPNLAVASRSYPTAQCQINTTTTYWLNVIMGSYNLSTGIFAPGCGSTQCSIGFQENDLN